MFTQLHSTARLPDTKHLPCSQLTLVLPYQFLLLAHLSPFSRRQTSLVMQDLLPGMTLTRQANTHPGSQASV